MADPSNPDRASAAKIETVSTALKAGKSLLDRSSRSAEIKVPEVARSLGEFARRPNVLAARIPNLEGHSIALDPTRVKLPEEAHADGSRDDQETSGEEIKAGKTMGDRPSATVQANFDPTPAGRAISSASLPVKTSVADSVPTPTGQEDPPASSRAARMDGSMERIPKASDRPEERTVPVTRSLPANGGFQDLGGVDEAQSRPAARSSAGLAGHPDSIGVGEMGLPSGREGVNVSAKVAPSSAVGGPQAGKGVQPQESRMVSARQDAFASVAHSGSMTDPQFRSSNHGVASINFVRNPLSTELRDFSVSGSAFPGQGGSGSDQGGFGKALGDPASGGASSPQGGTSGDLSKTNELLQQLIDAVRRQRGSSLPPGAPSVYPDR